MLGHVRAVAPVFQERLAALADHPLVGHARGRGLIGAIELVEDKATRRPFAPERKAAVHTYLATSRHGTFGRALPGDAVAFCPPLIIGEDDIHTMFDHLRAGLDEVEPMLRAEA